LVITATTSAFVDRRSQRNTVSDRAFAAAAPAVWNSLPEEVRSSTSLLPVFVVASSLGCSGVPWTQGSPRDFILLLLKNKWRRTEATNMPQ